MRCGAAGSLQRGRSLDYAHQLQASRLLQQGTLAAQPSHSLPTDSGGAQDLRVRLLLGLRKGCNPTC